MQADGEGEEEGEKAGEGKKKEEKQYTHLLLKDAPDTVCDTITIQSSIHLLDTCGVEATRYIARYDYDTLFDTNTIQLLIHC